MASQTGREPEILFLPEEGGEKGGRGEEREVRRRWF
jgi:hypothetical protein